MNIWDFERLLFIGGDEIALLLLLMVVDLVSVICIGSGGIGGNGHFFLFLALVCDACASALPNCPWPARLLAGHSQNMYLKHTSKRCNK